MMSSLCSISEIQKGARRYIGLERVCEIEHTWRLHVGRRKCDRDSLSGQEEIEEV